jgi:glutathione reductase (NADPH)
LARYDLLVIGGGSGGVACARRAAAYGAKVALCEPGRVGGTCVIRGCIPKKLMRYGARFPAHFRASQGYGWRLDPPRLDWAAMIDARDREIDRLNGVYIGMLDNAGVELIRAYGRVTGEHEVEVDGESHSAERILVAVGGKPSLPEQPGIEHAITSDDALENLRERPERMVVIGGGYVAVELACIFNGLGVETSLLVRREQPLRWLDPDLRQFLTEQMRAHGLDIRGSTTVHHVERAGGRLVVMTTAGPVPADAVLYATGRAPVPNTKDLRLDELGVAMNESGAILVDTAYRSSVPSIYAVGDCSDHAACGLDPTQLDLTPVAIAEGRVIAETLFNDNPHVVNYDTVPTAVFGIPEVASVGLTEAGARERGHEVRIFRTTFRPLLHTLTGEPDRTMMKLVVDRTTDRVLGCQMVGDDASEIIQGLAIALTAGVTKAHLDETVGLHPTAAEEFVTMYQAIE